MDYCLVCALKNVKTPGDIVFICHSCLLSKTTKFKLKSMHGLCDYCQHRGDVYDVSLCDIHGGND